MVAIGIDLGGTNIKAALVDKQQGILKKLSVPTEAENGKEHVFNRIKNVVEQLLDARNLVPKGIGIGAPGMVSLDRSTVKNPPNLSGWVTVNLAEEIKSRTGIPCVVDNDGNMAALGSSRRGVGRNFESLIMLTLGTGVGGGIIYNREIFRGSTGASAELGHVIIDYKGRDSNSNTRGGIEAYLGQRFLSRIALEYIHRAPDNPLFERFSGSAETLEPLDLFKEAEEGNELAIKILAKTGEKLGYAIVNYIHVLDIRKIIVTGGVANAGHWILEPARKTALETLMPPYREGFELLLELPENDVALYGASSLAFETF